MIIDRDYSTSVDNVENGMQAMAVAPIKNGKPDTSQVVIAFAGMNADEGLNILTDTQTVELNKNTLDISTKLNFNGYNKYTNQRFKVVKSMCINFRIIINMDFVGKKSNLHFHKII